MADTVTGDLSDLWLQPHFLQLSRQGLRSESCIRLKDMHTPPLTSSYGLAVWTRGRLGRVGFGAM